MKGKKCLLLSATAMMGVVALSGCGGKNIGDDIDVTKTQLYVKYNNGGMGDVWLNKLDDEFIDFYKDYSFEKGKKGVQIIRDDTKRNISANDVKGNKNMVFIQENNNYSEYVAAGVVKDLTPMLNDYAYTGVDTKETDRKIIDKIDDTFKAYLNYGNKYYAIPLFDANVGLNYNVELFETRNLFFKKGATAEDFSDADFENPTMLYDLFVEDSSADRSFGPDGKTGKEGDIDHTIDDGLPATYKDFRALVEMMKISGVTPFIWNNTDPNYLTSLLNDTWATNEGKERFIANFKMEGTSNDLVKIQDNKVVRDSSGKPVTETLAVTNDNYFELHRQLGKLQALDFAQIIAQDGNYYPDSFSTSYTTALEYFVNPDEHVKIGQIGMIVEGSWFLQEAAKANCFRGSEKKQYDAKFSPMILPKPNKDKIGEDYVRTSDRKSLMFISNFITGGALEVSERYLSFLQSDHALETYTLYTHNSRSMKYEISDETYNKMSYFGKCNWNITRHYNSHIIPFLPMSDYAKSKENDINSLTLGYATSKTGGNPVKNFIDWRTKKVNMTSEQYFVDIYNFKK